MAATPTSAEITEIRGDIGQYLPQGKTLDRFALLALAQIQRDLEDMRGIEWGQVYDVDGADYFTTRNAGKLKHLIGLYTVSLVFKDYAVRANEGQWWELSNAYRADYEAALKISKLDVDIDESGTIEDDEKKRTGQSFLRK